MTRFYSPLVCVLVACLCAAKPIPEEKNPAAAWGTPVDPDKDCAFRHDKGSLTIVVPGRDHDLGVERDKMNAPRVLRPVAGDFRVMVRIAGSFQPENADTPERAAFQGAGLLMMKDNKNYLRLERATFTRDGKKYVYASWELRQDGQVERFAQATDLPLDVTKDTHLKLQRRGSQVEAHVSQDGTSWQEMQAKTVEWPAELQVGVAAVNTATESFAPRFSEYKLVREGSEKK
jgi:regulation of enolase protein 1 (concanavalin A-like superfamily)